jgi:hypothetical protein
MEDIMTIRRIVLWCCIVSLLASPVVAYQYWDEFWQMVGIQVVPDVAFQLPPTAEFPRAC